MRRFLLPTAALLALATAAAAVETGPTRIGGFVDAAYFHDFNARYGTFGLDQVEVDVEHAAAPGTALRADLEWIRVGDESLVRVEQGYLRHALSSRGAVVLGKWNAPIGFEAVDPVDMYQYSHSLVWEYGAPTNLVGARYDHRLGDAVDVIAHVSNGWDADVNENRHVTWGGRLGYTRGALNVGLAGIAGKEGAPDGPEGEFTRSVLDVDLTWRPAGWVVGAEFNTGTRDAGGAQRSWMGFLLLVNGAYSERGSLTVRWDMLDDPDGLFFGSSVGNGPRVTRQSFTVANLTTLAPGATLVVEARFDGADTAVFTEHDGGRSKSLFTAAAELTFAF